MRREQILRAALELFAAEGSRGTSLAAIAERAGVTAPAITHHFGTKRALLMEVVEHLDRLDASTIPIESAGTGLDAVAANPAWARHLVDDPATARLARLRLVMVAEALDPAFPAHDHFVARNRGFAAAIIELLEAGRADGSIRRDIEPRIVAAEMLAFMQGAQLQWLLDPDGTPFVELVDRYYERLLTDIRAPRTSRARARSA